MYYNQILTTEQLIEEMKNFKWTRFPKELQDHHTWKPTVYSFNKAVTNYGLPKAYTTINDSMKTHHIKTYGGSEIAQHLTLFPDGRWAVGRNWNKDPISISGRNYLGFAIEKVGNFDVKGLSTTSENTLGYDTFHDTVMEKELIKFMKFFFPFFKLSFPTAYKFHRDHSYKTCPGNGIDKNKIISLYNKEEIPVSTFTNIKYGDKNERVADVQVMCNKLGAQLDTDGSFGPATRAEVASFQTKYGLSVTGEVDEVTYNRMIQEVKNLTIFINIKFGDKGERVGDVQEMFKKIGYQITVDESFGPATQTVVKTFQSKNNITASGIIDITTFEKLQSAVNNFKPEVPKPPVNTFVDLKVNSTGNNVKELQTMLNKVGNSLVVDGNFGNLTTIATKTFQSRYALPVTGVVNKTTWDKLVSVSSLPIQKSVWVSTRKYESDIKYAVLPQNKYFVDYDKGIPSVFEKTSKIVADRLKEGKKAVAAINAGFFGGNQDQLGLALDEGSYTNVPHADFIDLLYRKDGKMIVVNWDKDTPNVWANRNVYHWGMGTSYSLIQNGVINLQNIAKYAHAYTFQPRTLIGQKLNGDIVLVTIDGRSSVSRGMTAKQCADFMISLGCYQAVNLDGGGSTTAIEVLNGIPRVVNKPCDIGGERKVGSVLIVYEIV